MNAILLMCQHCDEVCGCMEPRTKLCKDCSSHDCPELPAPRRHRGYCRACAAAPRRYSPLRGWIGLPDPAASGA